MNVDVTLLTRERCSLCDTARAAVAEAVEGRDVAVTEVDIDTDADLQSRYDWEVPVVLVNGRQHSFHRVDPGRLARTIDAAAARTRADR